jgi:ankyrin repeat protein
MFETVCKESKEVNARQKWRDILKEVRCIQDEWNRYWTEYPHNIPLHLAVADNNVEAVKFLISKGADVHVSDYLGYTPLHWARSIEIAEFLVSNRANVNAKSKYGTPLHSQVSCGVNFVVNVEIIDFLISKGADLHTKDDVQGRTPLHMAVCYENIDAIKILVSRGADVNAKDGTDKTPLHWAMYRSNVDVVKCLVSHGADVNAKAKYCIASDDNQSIEKEGTPLDMAKANRNVAVIKYLASFAKRKRAA